MKKIISVLVVLTLIFSTYVTTLAANTHNLGDGYWVASNNGGNVNVRDYYTKSVIGSIANNAPLYHFDSSYDYYDGGYTWCYVYGHDARSGQAIQGYMRSDYITTVNPNSSWTNTTSYWTDTTSSWTNTTSWTTTNTASNVLNIAYNIKNSYGSSIKYNKDDLRHNYPQYIDCSAFVWRSYYDAGILINNQNYAPNTRQMVEYYGSTLNKGTNIKGFSLYTYYSENNLKKGDIVFYTRSWSQNLGSGISKGIGHTGIYIGNGQIIEANSTNPVIRTTNLSNPKYYLTYIK